MLYNSKGQRRQGKTDGVSHLLFIQSDVEKTAGGCQGKDGDWKLVERDILEGYYFFWGGKSYVDEVLEKVVAKNPAEPEFHQAVKEVLESLRVCCRGKRGEIQKRRSS